MTSAAISLVLTIGSASAYGFGATGSASAYGFGATGSASAYGFGATGSASAYGSGAASSASAFGSGETGSASAYGFGGTGQAKSALNEELWDAARAGDVARVARALDQGADVNSGNRYRAGALFFAADRGHTEVVKLLLDRGADINAQDTFYKFRPIMLALGNGHVDTVRLLLERGSSGASEALLTSIQRKSVPLATAALASKELTAADARTALAAAKRASAADIVPLIEKKIAAMPTESAAAAVNVPVATLQRYVGRYANDTGVSISVALSNGQLMATLPKQEPLTLVATSDSAFNVAEASGVSVTFVGRGGIIERMVVTTPGGTQNYGRVNADAAAAAPAPAPATDKPADAPPARTVVRTAPKPWPAFRGDNAAGTADGQGAVTEWNIDTGTNIRWKTPIPGIANASPIVWGTNVFVVTAISGAGDATFRTGLYGDVKPVDDLSEHTWKIYCLDKATGKILWEQTAFKGVPKVKRHTKASQANSTPVTDGSRVVALFGSVGRLVAWDMNGKELWNLDVGVLDSGWFFDPTYQWGFSSSPVIYKDRVIVQADVQKNSFIAAYDAKTGQRVWKTDRNEISSWGSPTVFEEQIVTNGPTVRAYDAETGKELWKLGPNSEITVGTPVVGEGLVYVTGGYPPARPIYAVKSSARGDISMPKEATSSEAVAWSNTAGTYIPTPLFYEGILYTCDNSGVVTAYDAKTGERFYRARAGGGGSFAASPIAADGKLYFANEDGDVIVVRAGRKFEEIAKNQMKEVVMSTPAISDGLIVVRTLGHVHGIGEQGK
jgi:outer membrane protein assembly factor BamB